MALSPLQWGRASAYSSREYFQVHADQNRSTPWSRMTPESKMRLQLPRRRTASRWPRKPCGNSGAGSWSCWSTEARTCPRGDAWDGEFRQGLVDQLMALPPEEGRQAAAVIDQAAQEILPFAFRSDHPRQFGFIPSSPTWPSVLADFMAAGFAIKPVHLAGGQRPEPTGAGGHRLVPALARLPGKRRRPLDQRRVRGEPRRLRGGPGSGRPSPAPHRVHERPEPQRARSRRARIIGIRPECIRLLPDDGNFRLDTDALARAVAEDRAAGFHPIAVCANAGASSTGAIDPVEAMADYCEAEGIWLHVDAAYGGFAVVTERGKELLRGIERADSVGLDAHKWFFQPYEVV